MSKIGTVKKSQRGIRPDLRLDLSKLVENKTEEETFGQKSKSCSYISPRLFIKPRLKHKNISVVYPQNSKQMVKFKEYIKYAFLRQSEASNNNIAYGNVGRKVNYISLFAGVNTPKFSKFAAQRIHKLLTKNLYGRLYDENLSQKHVEEVEDVIISDHILECMIKTSLTQIHEEFVEKYQNDTISGCSVTLIVTYNSTLYISWLGGCRAYVINDDESYFIIQPHNVFNEALRNYHCYIYPYKIEHPVKDNLLLLSSHANKIIKVNKILFDPQNVDKCRDDIILLSRIIKTGYCSKNISQNCFISTCDFTRCLGYTAFDEIINRKPDFKLFELYDKHLILLCSPNFWECVDLYQIDDIFATFKERTGDDNIIPTKALSVLTTKIYNLANSDNITVILLAVDPAFKYIDHIVDRRNTFPQKRPKRRWSSSTINLLPLKQQN